MTCSIGFCAIWESISSSSSSPYDKPIKQSKARPKHFGAFGGCHAALWSLGQRLSEGSQAGSSEMAARVP